jgi:hypothetical protein
MNDPREWTEDDVAQALDAVRTELLDFLRGRTRLDWFKHKVRWQLSRRYIWPGAPQGARRLVEDMVGNDPGVAAFVEHLRSRQQKISTAIERHNTAVRRLMEQQRGVPAADFDEASRQQLKQRRIRAGDDDPFISSATLQIFDWWKLAPRDVLHFPRHREQLADRTS